MEKRVSRVSAKKGSVTLAAILLALALTAGVVYFSGGDSLLTGLVSQGSDLGTQIITDCNISVWESINNIGHDYECYNAHGFILMADGVSEDEPLVLDCKNHSITLMTLPTGGFSGIWLEGRTNVKIQNCRIYNFTNGILLDGASNNNELVNNSLETNLHGVMVEGNNTIANHIHRNLFYNNILCGVNTSNQNNDLSFGYTSINSTMNESQGNVIYDNRFWNLTPGSLEACSDNTSYNYWHAAKACQETEHPDGGGTYGELNLSTINIVEGRCIGGNWWSTYNGTDITGDGLGDTNTPHLDGGLFPPNAGNSMIGDWYPLTDPCAAPGVICGDVTCPNKTVYTDSGGEGIAITCDNTNLTCDGTQFVGIGTGEEHMKGIEIIGVENIVVTGCEVLNFTYGFYVRDSKNVVIDGVSVHDNNHTGVYFGLNVEGSVINDSEFANRDTMLWENISGNWTQTLLWSSTGTQTLGIDFQSASPYENGKEANTISNNMIYNHNATAGKGIRLRDNSDAQKILSNYIYNNSYGISIEGSNQFEIYDNLLVDNNKYGMFFDDAKEGESLDNNNVSGSLDGYPEGAGIYFIDSDVDGDVLDNNLFNNRVGARIINSTVHFNYLNSSNSERGIYFSGSETNSSLGNSNIFNNSDYGLGLGSGDGGSPLFLFSGDMMIYNNSKGINIDQLTQTDISVNFGYVNVFNNSDGVYLDGSNFNNISGLNISGNTLGMHLINSMNNTIYNNYFSNNSQHVFEDEVNFWNRTRINGSHINMGSILGGDYLGGNFWDNFTGIDISGDGIADTNFLPSDLPFTGFGVLEPNDIGDALPLVSVGNISCGNIIHSIELTGNLTAEGDCYTILNNNITLDCAGHTIVGNGTGIGVNVSEFDNATIINCMLSNFSSGILINNSINSNISNNSVYDSSVAGLHLMYSNSTIINNNNFENNGRGVDILASQGNEIISNWFVDNSWGLWLSILSDNSIIFNNYFENDDNVFDSNVLGNNTWNTTFSCSTNVSEFNVLDEPCMGGNYWSDYIVLGGADNGSGLAPYNVSPWNISEDGIGDLLIPFNSSGKIVIPGDYLPLLYVPVECGLINRSTRLNQNLVSNGTCFIINADNIYLDFNGFTITGNTSGIGVNVSNKTGVEIIGANIQNFSTGIFVDPSSGIIVSDGNISLTEKAIYFQETNLSEIYNNTLFDNSWGLYLDMSFDNVISQNFVFDNDIGLELVNSEENLVYDNNFSNILNALDNNNPNDWNISYSNVTNLIGGNFSGGNFWSDYLGKDFGGGTYPYNKTNDGIGDSDIPYNINLTAGSDHLPLTNDDGSLSVDCPVITEDTRLIGDLTCTGETGIVIGADHITLDCNGHFINGTGVGAGVDVDFHQDIVIKNCNITNFYYGIRLVNTTNVDIIERNNIEFNDFYGVYIFSSTDTLINDSTIIDDNNGVYMISSSDTTISNNQIDLHKKFYGIYSYDGNELDIINNSMQQNYHGIYFVGTVNANVSNNNITDSDIYSLFLHSNSTDNYFFNNGLSLGLDGIWIRSSSINNQFINNTIFNHTNHGLRCIDSGLNVFDGNMFANNSLGEDYQVYVDNSASSEFHNNQMFSSDGNVFMKDSDGLVLFNNTVNSTQNISLVINDSSSLTINNNTLYNNVEFNQVPSSIFNYNFVQDNIMIVESSVFQMVGNNVTNNLTILDSDSLDVRENALVNNLINDTTTSVFSDNVLKTLFLIDFSSGTVDNNDADDVNGTSFDFETVTDSSIIGNNIQNATVAMILHSNSDDNTLHENWLKDNVVLGLNITSSTGNNIFNNYFENDNNVYDDSDNVWYTDYACGTPNIVGGPCKGGNFYSDYYGLDNGANGRDQGDGVGDQPDNYVINSDDDNKDTFPIVLYVSRQYFAPEDLDTLAMSAYAPLSGLLEDKEVVPNMIQIINYTSGDGIYMSMLGLFNQSNVHAEDLIIRFNENKTFINVTGVTGIDDEYNLYLNHQNKINHGIYVCPNANESLDSINSSCTDIIPITSFPTLLFGGNLVVNVTNDYYSLEGIGNISIGAGINESDYCGAHIFHNVILDQNISCEGDALFANNDGITIDLNGFTISGNGSGIGINVSSFDNVSIINGVVENFETAIFVDPAVGINVSGITARWNVKGIYFEEINESYISDNNIISNSNYGIHLVESINNTINNNFIWNNSFDGVFTERSDLNLITRNNISGNSQKGLNLEDNSDSNLIYDNYFDNTLVDANSGWGNSWNTTQNCSIDGYTNIIGGPCQGGNSWSNYMGIDTTNDGVGDINYPFNDGGQIGIGGDYLPIMEQGHIYCGGTGIVIDTNLTLTENVSVEGDCLIINSSNLMIDCNGNNFIGNSSGFAFKIENNDNVTIQNCEIQNFTWGIMVGNSTGSIIKSNTLLDNTLHGIILGTESGLLPVDDVTVYDNVMNGNKFGLGLDNVSNSNISFNFIYNSSTTGILLDVSNNNLVSGNILKNNTLGLSIKESNNNSFISNKVFNQFLNDGISINLSVSFNNSIYNNFFNSTYNAFDDGSNYWNFTYNCSILNYNNIVGGSCQGGNYWFDYNGTDNGNGTAPYDGYPWNVSDDLIGNQYIPYNSSNNISDGGDYLPLVYTCVEDWEYGDWSGCSDGSKSRNVTDINFCEEDYLETSTSGCEVDDDTGSGGGGGGSSSSFTETVVEVVYCSQSWTCGSWSSCSNGEQIRACIDENSCNTKLSSGSVTYVAEVTKPSEEQACSESSSEDQEVQVTYFDQDTSDTSVEQGGSDDSPEETTTEQQSTGFDGPVRTLALSSLAILFLFGGIFTYWEFGVLSNRVRRKLRKTKVMMSNSSIEILKQEYKSIYNMYLKLSERDKRNFYTNVNRLRGKIEEQLKAEKIVEELFGDSHKGDLHTQKKNYLNIYREYQKLAPKSQEKFYPKLVALKESLDHGKLV